jgi:hypothetical protein
MAFVFHRGLLIPLWPVVFCAVALAAAPRLTPSATTLLGIAGIASTMMAMVWWLRRSWPPAEAIPATGPDPGHAGLIMTTINTGTRARTLEHAIAARTREADGTVDLVRMDDDGVGRCPQPVPDGRPGPGTD